MSYEDLRNGIKLRSPIRFDYDPKNSADNHPASHLTVNETCCRVPLKAHMDAKRFIDFVFTNFYPHVWDQLKDLLTLPNKNPPVCIEDSDKNKVHINWN